MESKEPNARGGVFVWRVVYSHTIAYFLAGLFAVVFMNYREHYASASLSLLMRPVDSAIVALGPALQILRGLIIALVLYPLRKVFIGEKRGILKLALLLFGVSYLSTIGPTPGSFEGIVYTVLPLQYHLLGLPETLLYVALFCAILWGSYRLEKKWVLIASIVCVSIVCCFSVLGFLAATGRLSV